MKKFIALLLALAMVLTLFACGGKDKKKDDTSATPEVSESPSEIPTVEPTPEPVYVTEYVGTVYDVSSHLNVRSGPGTNYDVIGKAYAGDKFTVVETNVDGGEWHKIMFVGAEGYVHGNYLMVDEIQVEVQP